MLGQDMFDGPHDTADGVEPDAGQTHLGLGLATGIGDEHDRLAGGGNVPGVLRETTLETDVDRPAEMAGGEGLGRSSIDHHGTAPRPVLEAREVELGGWCVVV